MQKSGGERGSARMAEEARRCACGERPLVGVVATVEDVVGPDRAELRRVTSEGLLELCACGERRFASKAGRRRSLSLSNLADSEDMEDAVQALPIEEVVEEFAEAGPQIVVRQQDDRPRRECERCLRRDCVTVKPTVGLYTVEAIARHCTPDDCWLTAHGVVYDATRYLNKHPGGARTILSRAGAVDASSDFDFHSKYSKKRIWSKYEIGRVAVCTNPPRSRATKQQQAKEGDEECVVS